MINLFKYFIILFISLFNVQLLSAQYTVNQYLGVGRNPLNLNKDVERILPSYQTLLPFWQNPRSIYLPFRPLPFHFEIGGDTVNEYRVSNNGMVSFFPSSLPSDTTARMPSVELGQKTIALWGLKQLGGNDACFAKTYGTAPNRQHWIYFYSNSLYDSQQNVNANWAVVLCESNFHIYIVDMGSYNSPHFLTIGIQESVSVATEVRGSPQVSPYRSTHFDSYTSEDNTYYEFIPGGRAAIDLDLFQLKTPDFVKDGETVEVSARYRDLGTTFSNLVCISYQVNGSGAIYTDTIHSGALSSKVNKEINFRLSWVPSISEIENEIKFWIHDGNGFLDGNHTNDTIYKSIYTLSTNRWAKKYLLESHESAKLAFGGESKINFIHSLYLNSNIVGVAWHNNATFKDSMGITEAERIANEFNVFYPEGTIDRVQLPSESTINIDPSQWSKISDSLPKASSPFKIDVYGDDLGNQLHASAIVKATDQVSTLPKTITILLVEDSVQQVGNGFDQVNFFNNQLDHPFWNYGDPIQNYIHRKVVRAAYPKGKIWGDSQIIPNPMVLNHDYVYSTQIRLHPSWNKSNLSLVAFVSEFDSSNNTRGVLNVTEQKIGDLVTVDHEHFKKEEENPFLVYPNPVNNVLTIESIASSLHESNISIFSSSGKLVYTKNVLNSAKWLINVKQNSPGIYFLVIQKGERIYTKKILVTPTR